MVDLIKKKDKPTKSCICTGSRNVYCQKHGDVSNIQ